MSLSKLRDRLYFRVFGRWPQSVVDQRLRAHATAGDPMPDSHPSIWAFDQDAWKRGEVKLNPPRRDDEAAR